MPSVLGVSPSSTALCRSQAARAAPSKPRLVTHAAAPDASRTTVDSLKRSLAASEIPESLPASFNDALREERPADTSLEVAEASSADADAGIELNGSLKGMVLLNLGALLFGSNQVVIKTTEELLSPIALDALRFGAAALCFLPLLPRALKQPQLLPPALELGVWLTGARPRLSWCRAQSLSVASRRCLLRITSHIPRIRPRVRLGTAARAQTHACCTLWYCASSCRGVAPASQHRERHLASGASACLHVSGDVAGDVTAAAAAGGACERLTRSSCV